MVLSALSDTSAISFKAGWAEAAAAHILSACSQPLKGARPDEAEALSSLAADVRHEEELQAMMRTLKEGDHVEDASCDSDGTAPIPRLLPLRPPAIAI